MSTGSCVVRSHRAKSRSQREVCAASALDFELDIVTRWDLVFFLWKMRVCSVWGGLVFVFIFFFFFHFNILN